MIVILAESYQRAFHEAQSRHLLLGEWQFAATRSAFTNNDPQTTHVIVCGHPQTRRDGSELLFCARRFNDVEEIPDDAIVGSAR